MKSWHLRQPKIEHERSYEKLLQMHQLTNRWLQAVYPQNETALTRLVPPTLKQNLWLLEKLRLDQLPPDLETLIDAKPVTVFLEELEETLWLVQLSVLENLMESKNENERFTLFNQLEQVSWNEGKRSAESSWTEYSGGISGLVKALQSSRFWVGPNSFLVERQTDHSCCFYWMTSPLSRPSLQMSPEIQALCQLHLQSLRGFVYGLLRSVQFESKLTSLRETRAYRIDLETL